MDWMGCQQLGMGPFSAPRPSTCPSTRDPHWVLRFATPVAPQKPSEPPLRRQPSFAQAGNRRSTLFDADAVPRPASLRPASLFSRSACD